MPEYESLISLVVQHELAVTGPIFAANAGMSTPTYTGAHASKQRMIG